MARANFHEDLHKSHSAGSSSARGFGVVMGLFLLLAGLWPLRQGLAPRLGAVALAGVALLIAWLRPSLLEGLNRWWLRFGLLLGKVVNPLACAALFYLVFTPTGVIMRLMGRDGMGLRRQAGAGSYWIERRPPGPAPETMSQQF